MYILTGKDNGTMAKSDFMQEHDKAVGEWTKDNSVQSLYELIMKGYTYVYIDVTTGEPMLDLKKDRRGKIVLVGLTTNGKDRGNDIYQVRKETGAAPTADDLLNMMQEVHKEYPTFALQIRNIVDGKVEPPPELHDFTVRYQIDAELLKRIQDITIVWNRFTGASFTDSQVFEQIMKQEEHKTIEQKLSKVEKKLDKMESMFG